VEIIRKAIGGVRFGLLSPEFIRKMSVVEITVPELYDQDGFPVEGGLMDPRLGVIDPGMRCRTCGGKVGTCPGHFGHVELAKPVIHVRLAKEIYKWLLATCSECGKVKVEKKVKEHFLKELKRLEEEGTPREVDEVLNQVVKEARKHKHCPHCGAPSRKVEFEKPTTFYFDGEKATPVDVREWLEKIPDEDLPLLGLNPEAARPEWAVLTVLPIPPVTVRPSITLETGERSEDDLTHKLVDILRINLRLKENMASGAPAVIIEDLWELLQYHVTTLIDNETSGVPPARHRAGRILKGLVQRIKTKEGRFRRNLAGKRVNFSARTVISPDSRIGVDEVGVPYEICKILTVPVYVTEDNIEWLRQLVRNGPEELDGANYVIDSEGNRLRITEFNREQLAEQLEPGWIVERHLMDGDVVLMNRQPSLHRISIMAHFVRRLPGRTFRINPSICPPYNADFDGDEMNLHDPQGEEARAEAMRLLGVRYNLRSPRFGGVIIGGWRTQLSGLFLLTLKGTKLPREKAQQLLYEAGIDVELPKNKKEFTGKELFSILLPRDFSIRFKSKAAKSKKIPEEETEVVIENGKLVKGVIDENAVGAFSGVLLDRIIQEYGPDFAIDFINKMTNLALIYLRMRGITIGVDDFEIPDEARKRIKEVLDEAERDVYEMIERYRRGEFVPFPGMTVEQTLESEIVNRLNRARDKAVEIVAEYMHLPNPAVVMAISGARGKLLNIGLIAGAVGQQAIAGGRPTRGYYSNRTFPHFKPNDIGTKSKGFVRNAYGTGLDPFEFFWVSAAGREGLTDTGVKTPKSGYMYRRLSNALQDLRIEYDGTVRDASGVIVQFVYGEDGIDVNKSDWGSIDLERIAEVVVNASKKTD